MILHQMSKKAGRKSQTFNSGAVAFYSVELIAEKNQTSSSILKEKERLYFDEKTVGVSRFFSGKQNNVKVDRLIRCPRRENVSTQDIAIIGGIQYKIELVQYPLAEDVQTSFPLMDITLQRVDEIYEMG